MIQHLHSYLLLIPAFLIALTIHEFSHAAVATYFGDPTPRRMGRLTLNPLAHIDPIGLLMLLIVRVGWAKPVQFNPAYFKKPHLYRIYVALAGPFSNFVVAWLAFSILNNVRMSLMISQIFQWTAYINVMLGVFNLFPLPPLDGSHLLEVFLLNRSPALLMWLRQYSLFIILALFYIPTTRAMFINAILGMQALIQTLAF